MSAAVTLADWVATSPAHMGFFIIVGVMSVMFTMLFLAAVLDKR